jgi:uncharacterized protein (TIGR00255 family)
MTGFASCVRDSAAGQVSVELRSVNSRFLDLSFRMPDELRAAEWPLRELIAARVLRGKVDCRVGFRANASQGAQVNPLVLSRIAALGAQIRESFPDATTPSIAELLRWPGVLADSDPAADLVPEVLACARSAVDAFVENRAREGRRLIDALLDRGRGIEAIVDELAGKAPQLLAAQEARLVERLKAAVTALDAPIPIAETMARIRQEVAVHGMRIDIAEEIDRLRSHLKALAETCSGAGPIGKKLDFLLQEFNREANTLASKGAMPEVGRVAVELKLLIEQIREQIQNIE